MRLPETRCFPSCSSWLSCASGPPYRFCLLCPDGQHRTSSIRGQFRYAWLGFLTCASFHSLPVSASTLASPVPTAGCSHVPRVYPYPPLLRLSSFVPMHPFAFPVHSFFQVRPAHSHMHVLHAAMQLWHPLLFTSHSLSTFLARASMNPRRLSLRFFSCRLLPRCPLPGDIEHHRTSILPNLWNLLDTR